MIDLSEKYWWVIIKDLLKKYWWVVTLIIFYYCFWYDHSINLAQENNAEGRGLAFLLALPAAFIALILASQRTDAQSTQAKTDSNRLLTETFAKSIELLGNERSAVRQGAIYALGKIAETNKEELVVIINTLCAFIRHNQPNSDNTQTNLEIDIEAAIKTIVKISSLIDDNNGVAYDLSNINLTYADFSRANLVNFNLSDCVFNKCIFEKTKLKNCNLVGADFKTSNFKEVVFDEKTELHKTNLSKVENLTQEQINIAQGDLKTKLPNGLTRPASWSE